jgi:hypothetical protein
MGGKKLALVRQDDSLKRNEMASMKYVYSTILQLLISLPYTLPYQR